MEKFYVSKTNQKIVSYYFYRHIVTGGYRRGICFFKDCSGNSSESDSGPRAIVEIPGVDFFDDGSYAETVNGLGDLHLYVK